MTSTSSRTRSTSSSEGGGLEARTPITVVIALGSNLGDRAYNLRRAIHHLPIRVVRVSEFLETEPVDAPPPMFLNAVVTGYTSLAPQALMSELLALEKRLGRARRGVRNEPRVIDLDLIAYGATRMRTPALTLPHPRAHEREFVMKPLRSIWSVE
ncbi:MAG TPA: 2-amino-4-hydroxy-6-hydroxymethyldihydropteridine diphosphokinase [Thermoanaerobaculia bacterium]|jgi:2-amino-4-hydroxy-6-hydroxymethyldihydropteridine diphosphokinase|nr:2-amino-4-hydroxy-6-hydroxymethyldihydropteridine diphosphokinase [Thermoanaerobaculia bacterium]